jgi:hypothetical protein
MRFPSVPLALLVATALAVVGGGASCETYEPPPVPTIEGLASGVLRDSRAPLVVDFGTPIDLATLAIAVAFLEVDAEGNLRDEDADPQTELRLVLRHHPADGDLGARFELEPGGQRLRILPESALPVGPELVLLVEPGLRSTASGRSARFRQRVRFSYLVDCRAPSVTGTSTSTSFASGTYFVLLDVTQPLGTQIQLLAFLDADLDGTLSGQFTNADRDPNLKCPIPCAPVDTCRLLPAPECVPPSTRASAADEYPDFVPNPTPPTGYSFLVEGCVSMGEVGRAGILTAPATMVVESPTVTVEGLTMTAELATDASGAVRATGSLTADVVRLGTTPLGPGKGSMTAIRIPDDRVPAGVPRPPPRRAIADGGR